MKLTSIRTVLSRLLLFIAYVACILQWLWVFIIGIPPLIESGTFDSFVNPAPAPRQEMDSLGVASSPFVMWLVIAVTLAILVTTLIVLVRLPRTILNTGERTVQHVVTAATPIVTHHKPLPAKQRRVISLRLALAVQLTAVVLPGAVCLALQPIDGITRQIILTIGFGLLAIGLTAFIAAWLLMPVKSTSRTRSHAFRESH